MIDWNEVESATAHHDGLHLKMRDGTSGTVGQTRMAQYGGPLNPYLVPTVVPNFPTRSPPGSYGQVANQVFNGPTCAKLQASMSNLSNAMQGLLQDACAGGNYTAYNEMKPILDKQISELAALMKKFGCGIVLKGFVMCPEFK
jgi:hypothetical protein